MTMAALFGFFALVMKADQIIVGTALNIFAMGFAPFITKIVFNSSGSTPSLPLEARFTFAPIVMAFTLVAFIHFWLHQTRSGLYVQFAGEAPMALQASGTSVSLVRWMSLLACGVCAGFGGASLSLFLASSYSPQMTAGRGFMALAALIFGRWKPIPTMIACLFFAVIDVIQVHLQGVAMGVPLQLIQVLPYIVTIVALAGFFGHSRAPKSLGRHI